MLAVTNYASSVAQLINYLPNVILENVNYIQIAIPILHVDEGILRGKIRTIHLV